MTPEVKPEIREIEVYITTDPKPFIFQGWYRRDLEKANWHYYESISGRLYHFRKDAMIAVIDSPIKEVEE